jgi:hypothetical protein
MALLHIEGFEMYSSTTQLNNYPYYTFQNNFTSYSLLDSTIKRFETSNYSLRVAHLQYVRYKLPETKTEIITGVAVRKSSGTYKYDILQFLDSAYNSQLVVNWSGSVVTFKRGSTVIATSTVDFISGTWFYIATKIVFDDSTGSIEFWVNGVKDIDVTGLDTKNTSVTGIDVVSLYGSGSYVWFDDWYIMDTTGDYNNSIIPEARISMLLPSADTAQKDFTASTGSDNYAMLNDNNESAYVYASLNESKDLYEMTNIPISAENVYGMLIHTYAEKTDTELTSIKLVTESNGNSNISNSFYLRAGSSMLCKHLVEKDPNGNIEWTNSSINDVKVGMEINKY